MGAGALIQLSAIGAENLDLTVDATTTFWKSRYEKHTMFAIQPHELAFDPNTVGYGKTAKITITRSGDLVSDLWLVFELSQLNGGAGDARFTNDIGRALIASIVVDINNVEYDTRDGEYLHGYEKLAFTEERETGQLSGDTGVEADLELWATGSQKIYVPLSFWFTDENHRAFPIVALYQHILRLRITLRTQQEVIRAVSAPVGVYDPTTETGGLISNMLILCEYVYLQEAERNFFSAGQLKYLYTEIQKATVLTVSAGATALRLDLVFAHPCVELVWFMRKTSNGAGGEKAYMDWTGEEVAPYLTESFASMRLFINGQERFEARDPLYFRKVVTRQFHTRVPRKNIYCYSFALDPEVGDPSGNLNFSRVDNTYMLFAFTSALTESYELHVYARSLNYISIDRGLAKKHYA